MMDYGSYGRPPRRGHGRRMLAGLVAALVAAVAGVFVLGHVVTIGAASAARAPRPPASRFARNPGTALPPVTRAAGMLALGACVDPTSSIVSSFAPAIRRDLAQAVGSLAPSAGKLPTNTVTGNGPVTAPQAGVNLTVRQVTTNSLSTTLRRYTRNLVVPPVPGLALPRPEPGSLHYLSRLRTWTAGYEGVTAARAAARRAAHTGDSTIAGMPLDRRGWSGISACMSGLLTTVPPGGRHSYLLSSDLQENVTPQLAGSFHGAPLVIIQTCDTGNAAYCHGLFERFTRTMRRLDVGPIASVRPEVAAAAIRQWIRTGEVTP